MEKRASSSHRKSTASTQRFPKTPDLEQLPGAFDFDCTSNPRRDTHKSTASLSYWGAPSPDLTLSIHGLSPALAPSPTFSLKTEDGIFESREPVEPPGLLETPWATLVPDRGSFASVELSSFLSTTDPERSGTTGEDSWIDPDMVLAQQIREKLASQPSDNAPPLTSTPPRHVAPSTDSMAPSHFPTVEYDLAGRQLPSAPPGGIPFGLGILPPTTPPRSRLGSFKSAFSHHLPTNPGHPSPFWSPPPMNQSGETTSLQPPPPPSPRRPSPPRQMPRSQTEPSLATFSSRPQSSYRPLPPPHTSVVLPSFPPRSQSSDAMSTGRRRSYGGPSEADLEMEEHVVISHAVKEAVGRHPGIPPGGLGLAARRNVARPSLQPITNARLDSQNSPFCSNPSSSLPSACSNGSVATPLNTGPLTSSSGGTRTPVSASTVHVPLLYNIPPPTPPPALDPPNLPPFVSLFIDESSPAKSSARPDYATPPRGGAAQRMRQRFQLDSSTEASIPLETLAQRAATVERNLRNESNGDNLEDDGQHRDHSTVRSKKKRHDESSQSKWWLFGGTGQAKRGSRAEGWAQVLEETDMNDSPRTKEEIRVERERRKMLDARRKTQDWLSTTASTRATDSGSRRRWWGGNSGEDTRHQRTASSGKPFLRSRKKWIGLAGLILLGIVAVAVGVILSRKKKVDIGDCACSNGGRPSIKDQQCSCSCSGAWGGTWCHLNATCVSSDSDFLVAQAFLDIATQTNSKLTPTINLTTLPDVIYRYLAPSAAATSHSCKSQLDLLALPNLPINTYPTRLAWAESVILWTDVLFESSSNGLRTFASAMSFGQWGDVAAPQPNSNYQLISAGYTIDFAAMQVTVPTVSWLRAASPSSEQAALVSPVAGAALDRMNSYAVAASTQQANALAHYWTNELNRSSTDLSSFITAIRAADVIVPWDAGGTFDAQTSLLDVAGAQTNTSSFPPGLSCFGGLSAGVVEIINEVEGVAFGLETVKAGTQGNSTCLDRPRYGILNTLNLRTPFLAADARTTLPQQGIVLSPANKARCTLRAGELLVGASPGSTPSPATLSTPNTFGTFNNLNHVVLSLLRQLSLTVTNELIDYVLSSSSFPPPASSPLLDNTLMPIVEVQLWGNLRLDNIDHSLSSLTTSNGSLLFGSNGGDLYRTWALQEGGEIRWALNATSEGVVVDGEEEGRAFARVWDAVEPSTSTAEDVWRQLEGEDLVVQVK